MSNLYSPEELENMDKDKLQELLKYDEKKFDEGLSKALISVIREKISLVNKQLYRIDFIADTNTKTFSLEDDICKINPKWFEKLTADERHGVIITNCYRKALLHQYRANKFDKDTFDIERWQKASDSLICFHNKELKNVLNKYKSDKYIKPYTVTKEVTEINEKYKSQMENLSVESLYKLLEQKDKNNNDSGGNNPDPSATNQINKGNNPDITFKLGDTGSKEFKQDNLSASAGMLDQQSKMNAKDFSLTGLANNKQRIEILREPKIDWVKYINQFFSELSFDDFNWTTPDRRYLAHNIYFPGEDQISSIGDLTIYYDVSGSVSSSEMEYFLTEIHHIYNTYKPKKMVLKTFDTSIEEIFEFDEDNNNCIESINLKAGGGTDFTCIYKDIMQTKPENVILFSDLYAVPLQHINYKPFNMITVAINHREIKKVNNGTLIHIDDLNPIK